MNRTGSTSIILGSVPWTIFCTMTFRHEPSTSQRAITLGLEWLEDWRIRLRYNVNEWYWYLRPENGELNGRLHLHCLIRLKRGDFAKFVVRPGRVSAAVRSWAHGLSKFRPVVDVHDPVLEYILKEETSGADQYEIAKSSHANRGIPSKALVKRAGLQKSGMEPGQGGGRPAIHYAPLNG